MKAMMMAAIGAAAMVAGCSDYGRGGPRYAGYNGWDAYDYNRVDPAYVAIMPTAITATRPIIASADWGAATASMPGRTVAIIAVAATGRPV